MMHSRGNLTICSRSILARIQMNNKFPIFSEGQSTWFGKVGYCCCLPLLLNLLATFSQPHTNIIYRPSTNKTACAEQIKHRGQGVLGHISSIIDGFCPNCDFLKPYYFRGNMVFQTCSKILKLDLPNMLFWSSISNLYL